MASTLEQLAARLRVAPAQIGKEMRAAVTAGGQVLAGSARSSMPQKLRGMKATPISARALPAKGVRKPTSIVVATGPAWLVDNPTKPHEITAKGTPLSTPYGPRRAVHHPGTAGKHTFKRGVVAAAPTVRALIEGAFRRAGRFL